MIDGGITSDTPISAAVALGAKHVVVLPTGYSCALTESPPSVVAMVLHALTPLIARQLVVDVVRWRDAAEIVVVPPLCPVKDHGLRLLRLGSADPPLGGEHAHVVGERRVRAHRDPARAHAARSSRHLAASRMGGASLFRIGNK